MEVNFTAPEHVRPVCSQEAMQIPKEMPTISQDPIISEAHRSQQESETIPQENIPELFPEAHNPPSDNHSQSLEQPVDEPEAMTPPESTQGSEPDPAVETPSPEETIDDDLVTTHLLCCDVDDITIDPKETPCAWKCGSTKLPHARRSDEVDQ